MISGDQRSDRAEDRSPGGDYSLVGKVALVTGGSSGIGAACARRLAAAGAHVIVGYRDGADRARTIADALPGAGHRTIRIAIDERRSIDAAVADVAAEHAQLDVLVNSAGTTALVAHEDLEALTDELFDRILTVNVRGTFAVIRGFAPLLRASGDGVIVTITSISATTGRGSSIAYCAAKAALDTMSLSLARVLAPEVRVLTVSPAAVDTDFVPGRSAADVRAQAANTPLRQIARADDIAGSVVGAIRAFRLATGTNFVVDGGRHL